MLAVTGSTLGSSSLPAMLLAKGSIARPRLAHNGQDAHRTGPGRQRDLPSREQPRAPGEARRRPLGWLSWRQLGQRPGRDGGRPLQDRAHPPRGPGWVARTRYTSSRGRCTTRPPWSRRGHAGCPGQRSRRARLRVPAGPPEAEAVRLALAALAMTTHVGSRSPRMVVQRPRPPAQPHHLKPGKASVRRTIANGAAGGHSPGQDQAGGPGGGRPRRRVRILFPRGVDFEYEWAAVDSNHLPPRCGGLTGVRRIGVDPTV